MRGINQDRATLGNAGLDAGMQPVLDLMPVALNHGIAVELLTDSIRGQELRVKQRSEKAGSRGFAAGWRANEKVAAQCGSHEHIQDLCIIGGPTVHQRCIDAKNWADRARPGVFGKYSG